MGRKVPDGWLDYRPIRDPVFRARIVPIKTPLPDRVFWDDLSGHRWTPSDVMQTQPNIGLIIDITNKFPAYYNIREFIDNGVAFKKIACIGHHVPSEEVYRQFHSTVEEFLAYNHMNDRIIALHCTHGVNRTGYLLCRYLIEKFHFSPEQAMETFAISRGYPIERENYKEALFNLVPRRY